MHRHFSVDHTGLFVVAQVDSDLALKLLFNLLVERLIAGLAVSFEVLSQPALEFAELCLVIA